MRPRDMTEDEWIAYLISTAPRPTPEKLDRLRRLLPPVVPRQAAEHGDDERAHLRPRRPYPQPVAVPHPARSAQKEDQ